MRRSIVGPKSGRAIPVPIFRSAHAIFVVDAALYQPTSDIVDGLSQIEQFDMAPDFAAALTRAPTLCGGQHCDDPERRRNTTMTDRRADDSIGPGVSIRDQANLGLRFDSC